MLLIFLWSTNAVGTASATNLTANLLLYFQNSSKKLYIIFYKVLIVKIYIFPVSNNKMLKSAYKAL